MDFKDAEKVWKDEGIEEKTGVSFTRKLWNGIKNNMISGGTAKNIAFGAGKAVLDIPGVRETIGGVIGAGVVGGIALIYGKTDKKIQDNPLISDENKAISTEIKNKMDEKFKDMKD